MADTLSHTDTLSHKPLYDELPVEDTISQSKNKKQQMKSAEEFKMSRDSRANEAIKVKDDQIKLLTKQNNTLLRTLDKLEDDFTALQMERITIQQEQDNTTQNLNELNIKLKAAESHNKRVTADYSEKEKQVKLLTEQNMNLLRSLEKLENDHLIVQDTLKSIQNDSSDINQRYSQVLLHCKQQDDNIQSITREIHIKNEEIRLLKIECEQLRQVNNDVKMKVEVEIESLQEQLRVRKEKQYHLLEKVNIAEEAKRYAEDQMHNLEEKNRILSIKCNELDIAYQNEMKLKGFLEVTNNDLKIENNQIYEKCKELQNKIDKIEKDALKSDAEARDSSEQLREMAEKVFQLLERLKLTELSKTKAMESLKKKETEILILTKTNNKLSNDILDITKSRDKYDIERKDALEQLRIIRKQNAMLIQKSKDETSEKLSLSEQIDTLRDQNKVAESRIAFLVNKVQTEEDTRLIQIEDRKKLETQVMKVTSQNEELQRRLNELTDSQRLYNNTLKAKQDELNQLQIKYEDTVKELNQRDIEDAAVIAHEWSTLDTSSLLLTSNSSNKPGGQPDDIENVRLNEGRGRFYLEAKTTGAGAILVLKARKPVYMDWINKYHINEFLRKAQKTSRFREMMIEKVAMIYGLFMVEEEEKDKYWNNILEKDQYIEQLLHHIELLQQGLAYEEEAKRRMLLRYVHVVKDNAMLNRDTSIVSTTNTSDILNTTSKGASTSTNSSSSRMSGILQLPDSNITDEEMHALSALLRNDHNIVELNLRNNHITDDGARALAAVLANKTALKLIDLRGNKIGKPGVRILAEALEKSERVSHVYVHIGGKIEALGEVKNTNNDPNNSNKDSDHTPIGIQQMPTPGISENTGVTISTLCIIDVRENNPSSETIYSQLQSIEAMNYQRHKSLMNMSNMLTSASTTTAPANSGGGTGSISNGIKGPRNGLTNNPFHASTLLSSPNPGFSLTQDSIYNNSQFSMMPQDLSQNNSISNSTLTNPNMSIVKSTTKPGGKKKNQSNKNGPLISSDSNDADDKKNKTKILENMKLALRENLWQGRNGGYDINTTTSLPVNSDIITTVIKKSQQMQQQYSDSNYNNNNNNDYLNNTVGGVPVPMTQQNALQQSPHMIPPNNYIYDPNHPAYAKMGTHPMSAGGTVPMYTQPIPGSSGSPNRSQPLVSSQINPNNMNVNTNGNTGNTRVLRKTSSNKDVLHLPPLTNNDTSMQTTPPPRSESAPMISLFVNQPSHISSS